MIFFEDKTGQLGNNLFELGTFLAIAKEQKHWLVNFHFNLTAEYFKGTNSFINFEHKSIITQSKIFLKFSNLYRCFLIKFKHESLVGKGESYDLENKKFESRIILKKGGWFTDFNNFYKNQDYIRNYFNLVPHHADKVKNFVKDAKKDIEYLIGIHIRRGDYIDFCEGQFYFEISDYKQMMNQIEEVFDGKNVRFVIASNEQLDASLFGKRNVVIASGHFVYDLYVLSNCDYIFGPPSTYTMWASFIGNKPLLKFREKSQIIKIEEFIVDYGY